MSKFKTASPYTKSLIQSAYWREKSLHEMTRPEWEAICDGCARCCLHKFIDDETSGEDLAPTDHINQGEEVLYTNIACYLLNDKTCACTQYDKRTFTRYLLYATFVQLQTTS
jgi:uncharacterized cysteine cluster protein YcgN (CxxCxxCC family)